MVWNSNGPPEKEHPLTTLGACGMIFIVGFFGAKWGWAVLRFAFAFFEETAGTYRGPRVSAFWIALAGAMLVVGVVFMVGAVWWAGKAINAWRRGEMVE